MANPPHGAPGHVGHELKGHTGHDERHGYLVLLYLLLLLISQGLLILWKTKSFKSFQSISLVGLWCFPILHSVYHSYARFSFVWSVYTAVTAYFMYLASQSPMAKSTPKWVYMWFYFVYHVSYGAALLGYLLLMVEVVQLYKGCANTGVLFIFYGLYFGVLGTDCAEVSTERIASKMGYTGKGIAEKMAPHNMCCICGEHYKPDEITTLSCNHTFHQWCINGWVMIGKKNTCPYCSEKVEIHRKNPWERTGHLWSQLLDLMRTIIVWNPVILYALQIMLTYLDPADPVPPSAVY